jgi:hypothetical protein
LREVGRGVLRLDIALLLGRKKVRVMMMGMTELRLGTRRFLIKVYVMVVLVILEPSF